MGILRKIRQAITPGAGSWKRNAAAYRQVIHDPRGDSVYLRERGLKPNVRKLIPQGDFGRVLDVGCGDGWLFDEFQPEDGWECDIASQVQHPRKWPFSVEDVVRLSFEEESFDLIVASLVLMFVEDLPTACRELFRVAAPDACLVVALTHPCFYRMGDILDNGDVRVRRKYLEQRVIPDLYIAGRVGPFRYYHRPLCDYLNNLIGSGWTITEFREWAVNMDDYEQNCGHVRKGLRRTDRLPLYAFVQCMKKGCDDQDWPLRNQLDT